MCVACFCVMVCLEYKYTKMAEIISRNVTMATSKCNIPHFKVQLHGGQSFSDRLQE